MVFDRAFLQALTAEGPVDIREVDTLKVKLERPGGGRGDGPRLKAKQGLGCLVLLKPLCCVGAAASS